SAESAPRPWRASPRSASRSRATRSGATRTSPPSCGRRSAPRRRRTRRGGGRRTSPRATPEAPRPRPRLSTAAPCPRSPPPAARPDGDEVRGLKDGLRRAPAALEPHLARVADPGATPFAALNTAFLDDGAFVRLAAGTVVAAPIHLLFFSTTAGAPTVSYPRT